MCIATAVQHHIVKNLMTWEVFNPSHLCYFKYMYGFIHFNPSTIVKWNLVKIFCFRIYITVILFFLEGYPVVKQVHLNKRVYMYKPILHGLISICDNAKIRVKIFKLTYLRYMWSKQALQKCSPSDMWYHLDV